MDRKRHRQAGAVFLHRLTGHSAPQSGFSLFELLFVIVIVGFLASVMMPSNEPGDSLKLDLAAAELADAMRFARGEALRLGVAHGVSQQSVEKRVRVFSMNVLIGPATLVYDIYHPVDRNLYDRNLGSLPFDFSGEIVQNATFRGTCNTPGNIYFDAQGIPWCADPANVLVSTVETSLTLGLDRRLVSLNGVTGRVTIQ